MRKTILFFIILSMSVATYSQVQEAWLQIYNQPSNWYDEPAGIVVDPAGNSYVLRGDNYSDAKVLKFGPNGDFLWIADASGTPEDITIDGAGNIYITTSGSGYRAYKYTSSGLMLWTRTYSFGGNGSGSFAIAVDNSGNVYITGKAGVNDDYDLTDFGTVKFNSVGDFQWARTYNGAEPGTGQDFAEDIALDGAGNIYVTGTSQLDGQMDIATLKYSPAGVLQWVKRYNGTENHRDIGRKLIIDENDNIYVGGMTEGEAYNGSSFDFMTDIVVLKYSSAGDEQWVSFVNAGTHDVFRDMLVDGSGNVFVDSYYEITAPGTLRISKFNSSGIQQWSKDADTRITEGRGSYIAKDGAGNIYVTAVKYGNETYADIVTIKFNTNGGQLWMMHFVGGRYGDDAKRAYLGVDALGNVYMTCIYNGGSATNDDVALLKYTQCEINIDDNIILNSEAGLCGVMVNITPTTLGDCGDVIVRDISGKVYSVDSFYSVGHYHLEAFSPSTGATKRFTIRIKDEELPVITYCPPSKSLNTDPGACYVSAANANIGLATATDNCSVTVKGVRSDGEPLSANYQVGNTTITWTAKDASGNTATCSQTITVVDNIPPTITDESASTYVLSPPNHTMRDVSIDYTIADNCSADTTITITSNEPINGVGDGDTDPDWIIVDKQHFKLRAERSAKGTGRIYTITITATDPSGNTAVKTIEVKVPHNIKNPHSGKAFIVGSTVSFEGEFWDKPGNKHTAKWLIDGSTTAKGTVTEPSGNKNGKVTGSYKFTAPGVYKLRMNVTDQNGVTHYASTAGDLEAIVVIYDPNGGHTYGGGYFNSPAGALKTNPSSTGKASYGFAMNYFKNSTNPKGETQFEFKVGDFEFNALNFEYLVINSSMAQFKGTGKIIGGQSGVGFTMTVVDGQLDGTGIDKIRMKIYNKNNNAVIYDNQFGASDAALPTQAVGENSIVVIQSNKAITSRTDSNDPAIAATLLQAKVLPNPSNSAFSIVISSNNAEEKVMMEVVDAYGRVIELRRSLTTGTVVTLGNEYAAGIYFVRITQGHAHKQLKLIKL